MFLVWGVSIWHWYTVLNFYWHIPKVFKARVDHLLPTAFVVREEVILWWWGGGGYPIQLMVVEGSTRGTLPPAGGPAWGTPGRGGPCLGYPWQGCPTRGTTPPRQEQHSVYLLRGGRYASCIRAGGLSCFLLLSCELPCRSIFNALHVIYITGNVRMGYCAPNVLREKTWSDVRRSDREISGILDW